MLKQNELLVYTTKKLTGMEPDWEKVVKRFRDTWIFENVNYDDYSLASRLSEIHLRLSLEKVSENLDWIVFDPVDTIKSTKSYRFKYLDSGLTVISKENGKMHSQMDEVLLIDNLPVLFEIKLTRHYTSKGRSCGTGKKRMFLKDRITHPGSIGVTHAMRKGRIKHITDPLKEYFKTCDCGYVLMIYPEQIRDDSNIQMYFRKMGGILVPFYTDRETYRAEVPEIKKKYEL
jgi:hypothetical protein